MKYTKIEHERVSSLLKTTRITKNRSWYEKVILPKVFESKEKYQAVAKSIGCPVAFVILVHLRENGGDIGNFKAYLGNGQPFNKKTTNVPKGRGPFRSWSDGAIDALRLAKIDKVQNWTVERMLFELEKYNGFGYRNRGINTPYVWNFTNHYSKGHYVADGKFKASSVDKNIGAYAFYLSLVAAEPSFNVSSNTDLTNFPVVDESPAIDEWLERVWVAFLSFLAVVFGVNTAKKAEDGTRMSRNKKVLLSASSQLGVKEFEGSASNEEVEKYYDAAEDDGDSDYEDHVPWCAAFISWICVQVGMGLVSRRRLLARSWEKWGVSTLENPLPGDFVTFYRQGIKSGKGHIAVLLKVLSDGRLVCLGGNQNDEVNVSIYSPERMTDIRRSSKSIEHTKEEIAELVSIADDIMDGRPIEYGGKVA